MSGIVRLLVLLVAMATFFHVISADRKPCCFPDKWSGNIVQTIGEYNSDYDVASLAYGSTELSVDYTGKQMALRERRDNETMQIVTDRWIIYKYSTNKKYVIEKKKCVVSDLKDIEQMEPKCMPGNASFFGTHLYPGGVMVDVWFYNDDIKGGQKRVGVTSGCVPITLSQITGGPDYHLNMFLYQNITTTIKDPSIFDVPASCNKIQTMKASGRNVNEKIITYEMEIEENDIIY